MEPVKYSVLRDWVVKYGCDLPSYVKVIKDKLPMSEIPFRYKKMLFERPLYLPRVADEFTPLIEKPLYFLIGHGFEFSFSCAYVAVLFGWCEQKSDGNFKLDGRLLILSALHRAISQLTTRVVNYYFNIWTRRMETL